MTPDRTALRPSGQEQVAALYAGAQALVTGGAGFIGSHVCRALHSAGLRVHAIDSLITSNRDNLADLIGEPGFSFSEADITEAVDYPESVALVLHLASPASPLAHLQHPIHTLNVGSSGTLNALKIARATGAVFLLASTSEIYGDPRIHPQPEDYVGIVDQTEPRGVYAEAKRYAEALTYAHERAHGVPVRVARIFNTYGPGMMAQDGRLIPSFIRQALLGEPLTVHGDGRQTRSFCYIDDLVDGLLRLLASERSQPCNLGADEEVSVLTLVEMVNALAGARLQVTYVDRPAGDPQRRRPELTVLRQSLGWEASVGLDEGLRRTYEWARDNWGRTLT